MHRRAWLGSLVAVLPLLGGAGWLTVHLAAGSSSAALMDCCTPDCYPGCCDACPPDCCSTGQALQVQPVAKAAEGAKATSGICPLSGEELPSPSCCPLNQQSSQVSAKKSCCPLGP